MAKLEAVRCDKCGAIVEKDDAVEKLTRYKGRIMQGQHTEDLCGQCAEDDVPEGVELKPWPRMKDGDSADEG